MGGAARAGILMLLGGGLCVASVPAQEIRAREPLSVGIMVQVVADFQSRRSVAGENGFRISARSPHGTS